MQLEYTGLDATWGHSAATWVLDDRSFSASNWKRISQDKLDQQWMLFKTYMTRAPPWYLYMRRFFDPILVRHIANPVVMVITTQIAPKGTMQLEASMISGRVAYTQT